MKVELTVQQSYKYINMGIIYLSFYIIFKNNDESSYLKKKKKNEDS